MVRWGFHIVFKARWEHPDVHYDTKQNPHLEVVHLLTYSFGSENIHVASSYSVNAHLALSDTDSKLNAF